MDKFGRRTLISTFAENVATTSCALMVIGNFYFAFLPTSVKSFFAAFVGYVIIGTSYCLFGTAIWPMIPYVVNKRVLGTAYGIVLCFQSVGPIFGPIVVGRILDQKNVETLRRYFHVNIFLGVAAAVSTICAIILTIVDRREGGMLMASNEEQKKIEEKEES